MTYSQLYIKEAQQILDQLNSDEIERMAELIDELRQAGGRLFLIGSGGGAAHASHAVCDFRKIVGIEAYTPTDNVAELTARVNDEGWDTAYVDWLKVSKLSQTDMIFVFSVGGGDLEKNISPNIVLALKYAKEIGVKVLGVVGRNDGYTAEIADACIIIPTVNPSNITAHTESFQALVWHMLVSHPVLRNSEMKWESII
jgi:D-sedoheptulose 7-phosphate isomerase